MIFSEFAPRCPYVLMAALFANESILYLCRLELIIIKIGGKFDIEMFGIILAVH